MVAGWVTLPPIQMTPPGWRPTNETIVPTWNQPKIIIGKAYELAQIESRKNSTKTSHELMKAWDQLGTSQRWLESGNNQPIDGWKVEL